MCQMAVKMEAATAQTAFFGPRRWRRRWNCARSWPSFWRLAAQAHQGRLEPGRALAQAGGAAPARALVAARAEAGPGHRVGGGGEAAHVAADLGHDGPGGEVADA